MRQGHCGENMDAIKPVSTRSFSTFEPSPSANVCKMRAIFLQTCAKCVQIYAKFVQIKMGKCFQ